MTRKRMDGYKFLRVGLNPDPVVWTVSGSGSKRIRFLYRNKDKLSIKQGQEDKEFSVSDHIFNVEAKIRQTILLYEKTTYETKI